MTSESSGNKAYKSRDDLTREEILAINHYKDLVKSNRQYKWNYPVAREERGELGVDCYMVNNVLRGFIPKSSLTRADRVRFDKIVEGLTSAISKSRVTKKVVLVKGLADSSWIEGYKIRDTFKDSAFGSFSTSWDVAKGYASKNKSGKRVYVLQTLNPRSQALFFDNDESEYLLQKGRKYQITKITKDTDSKEIIYYVRRI